MLAYLLSSDEDPKHVLFLVGDGCRQVRGARNTHAHRRARGIKLGGCSRAQKAASELDAGRGQWDGSTGCTAVAVVACVAACVAAVSITATGVAAAAGIAAAASCAAVGLAEQQLH